MTETTALLRALHCDLMVVCSLLAALYNESGGTLFLSTEDVSKSLSKASGYCRLADELEKKTGGDAHGNRSAD